MLDMLCGVREQLEDRDVNSLITDAAHKYFIGDEKLLVTVKYALDPPRWVPVALAYTQRERAQDYRWYFAQLLKALAT